MYVMADMVVMMVEPIFKLSQETENKNHNQYRKRESKSKNKNINQNGNSDCELELENMYCNYNSKGGLI